MSDVKLMLGDCLERMKEIPDGSVDMVLCDLPYNSTRNLWDCAIDLPSVWEAYNRIITKKGAIVLFAQTPFDKVLGCSNLSMLKYEWIWQKSKPTGFLNANFAPMKTHENILVFSKSAGSFVKDASKAMQYYPQGLTISGNTVKRTSNGNYDDINIPKESVQKFTGYPKDVLLFQGEHGLHPTQKPVELCDYLIKTYTTEGQTVLDNTMGSGTTGVACVNTNRSFIGIEMDEGYFNIATKRINEAKETK